MKILVLHSYEADYVANEVINEHLRKNFKRNQIKASVTFFYLDCERYMADEELVRCSALLDSLNLSGERPDIILTLDDQATYSLLKSDHAITKECPIVFSGVSFPNWDLLKEFSNVTGLWNKPDYSATIEMIKLLFGNKPIMHLSDMTALGKRISADLSELPNIKYYKDVQLNFNFHWETVEHNLYRQYLSDTLGSYAHIIDFPIRTLTGSNTLWYISGINGTSVLLLTKRDVTTYNPRVYSSYPLFTTLNEGMGFGQNILAGCVSVLEKDLERAVQMMSQILNGVKVSDIPIVAAKNEKIIDWLEMKRWGIEQSVIPKTWTILNIPFWEKHVALVAMAMLLFVVGLIAIIMFLRRRLSSEIRKKKMVQKDLDWRNSILSLVMEKGSIFTWKYDIQQQELIFEKEFFDYLKIPVTKYSLTCIREMLHPDDCIDTMTMLKNYLQKDEGKLTFNTRIRFTDEIYTWWEFRCAPVMKSDSGDLLIAGLCLSVQEYKDREQELIEARDLAAKAELKESFLANMSHEIRTPLNAIVGFSNLLVLENDFSGEEKRQFIDSINKNCEMLLKLINDILEISRIESGNMSFKFEEVSLKSFMDDVYLTHNLLISSDVKFEKKIPEKDIILRVDKIRLNQVLTNFINNAAKFTQKGYIRIGYYFIETMNRSGKNQPELCIYVEDTGKGIPKEQQQLIFNRFYKQDEFAQGTGLGLSICSVIVQRFGGYISLDSEVGKGSRFIVHFPLNEKLQVTQSNLELRSDSGKPVILIAEDHDSNYLLLRSILQSDYEIIRVLNGEGAIKAVRQRADISLILMDIKMIGMNGLEATDIITREFPHIPVIIQTAYALEFNQQMAKEAGCIDFMTKPISPAELKAKVVQFIQKR